MRSRNSISPRIADHGAELAELADAARSSTTVAAQRLCVLCGCIVAIAGTRVEDLEHPLPARHAALQHVRHPAERDHRPAQHRQVGELNATNCAERDPAADHLAAAEPQHQHRAEAEEERHAREEEALQRDQPAVAPQVLLVGAPEPLELGRLLPVGADDADARQRLLRDRADLGQLRLNLLEAACESRCRSTSPRSTRTAAG